MSYVLENELCRVKINSRGAELSSLVRKDLDHLEYIWEGDPAVWGRHAPVLFPIVGRLPHDQFQHRGQAYPLSQHGFARDQEFALVHQTGAELVFELRANDATRAVFPFEFSLRISYRLAGAQLTIGWEVRHLGADDEMLFSIGAHPAFRCPLQEGEAFEDYEFVFDRPVTFERHLLQGGLLSGATAPVLDQQTTLPLTYELFADDALVLKHFDFTHLTLRSRRSGRGVRARFDGFPYLGLWTKGPGARFVCIEPWHGIASSVGDTGELADKEGILSLRPGQEFVASYSIAAE